MYQIEKQKTSIDKVASFYLMW